MSIFEQASRQKLRVPTSRGHITVEELWDIPLQSKTAFSLDTIAKSVNSSLKQASEESFVSTYTSPAAKELELTMEIIKHVIAVKIADNVKARDQVANRLERDQLNAILANKQSQKLMEMDEEAIKKRLAELQSA